MIEYHMISANEPLWQTAAQQIGAVEWGGGPYLARRMTTETWQPWEKVIYATSGSQMVGFCALLAEDIVRNTAYTPFVSAVYVNPDFRGHDVSLNLVKHVEALANATNQRQLYIVTRHVGLYEHLNYQQIDEKDDQFGIPYRILVKQL